MLGMCNVLLICVAATGDCLSLSNSIARPARASLHCIYTLLLSPACLLQPVHPVIVPLCCLLGPLYLLSVPLCLLLAPLCSLRPARYTAAACCGWQLKQEQPRPACPSICLFCLPLLSAFFAFTPLSAFLLCLSLLFVSLCLTPVPFSSAYTFCHLCLFLPLLLLLLLLLLLPVGHIKSVKQLMPRTSDLHPLLPLLPLPGRAGCRAHCALSCYSGSSSCCRVREPLMPANVF